MKTWLVTVKVPPRWQSDESSRVIQQGEKITGSCPANPGMVCTDILGAHHTVPVAARTPEDAVKLFPGLDITRVEEMHF